MQSTPRISSVIFAILLVGPSAGSAQALPSRLALFQDPTPITSPGNLVLGSTTLDEARRLFPDAPPHPGPLPFAARYSNPMRQDQSSTTSVGSNVFTVRSYFLLGRGRASLLFDDNDRLVSVSQGRTAYYDPVTRENVELDELPWSDIPVSRNEFHARYPGTTGRWVDRWHYVLEGIISECLAIKASFTQSDGIDQLNMLDYHYTCATQPALIR